MKDESEIIYGVLADDSAPLTRFKRQSPTRLPHGIATVQNGGQQILSHMSDGGQRSFDEIWMLVRLEYRHLQITLEDLVEVGWLEINRERRDPLYVITFKGLREGSKAKGPPPLYQS
jgi:predicted transcriptional regulator